MLNYNFLKLVSTTYRVGTLAYVSINSNIYILVRYIRRVRKFMRTVYISRRLIKVVCSDISSEANVKKEESGNLGSTTPR